MKIFLVFSVEIIVIYLTNSLSLSFSSKLLIFSRFRFLFFCVKDLFLHILFSSQGTESVSMLAYTLQRTDILEKNLYIKDSLSLWWRIQGSNLRPPACKAGALPAELIPHKTHSAETFRLLRKEVIQPQVLLRLPCYDFTSVIGFALGNLLLVRAFSSP